MYGIFCKDLNTNFVGHIMAEIYKDRIYEPFMTKDMTIVEVGANIGLVTLYFSQYAKKIYALEPSKNHLKYLNKTVNFNKLNVEVIPLALDGTDGKKSFYNCKNNTTMSSLKQVLETESTDLVECVTMTTLFERYDIKEVDFMKLDVEGAEIDILKSESFKKEASKIKSMTVEYHSWCGYSPEKLEILLVLAGFKIQKLKSDALIYYAKRN